MLSMKILARLLSNLKTKKTKLAAKEEVQIREVTRLGQSLVVMELS